MPSRLIYSQSRQSAKNLVHAIPAQEVILRSTEPVRGQENSAWGQLMHKHLAKFMQTIFIEVISNL